MAEQLTCQNCNKSYNTAADMTPHACPHCGFIFSKLGSERSEKRFQWSAYCYIFDDKIYNPMHTPLIAKTQDISQYGAKIRYAGKPLTPGDTVDIYTDMFNQLSRANVMWSMSINETDSMVGLKLVEPIPESIIIGKD